MHIPTNEAFCPTWLWSVFWHTGIFTWFAKNIFFIVMFMVPSVGIAALFAAYKGVCKLWKDMAENSGVDEALYQTVSCSVR